MTNEQTSPPQDLKEFDKEIEEVYALKNEVALKTKQLKERKNALLSKLQAMDKRRHVAKSVQIFLTEEPCFALPKEPQDKALFYEYLKKEGLYDSTISVHSRTFNSLCKGVQDEALEKGELNHGIPGVGEPTLVTKISFRKV